uniref:Uncharacterized protein n=1 Tax=Rhizophora mucronata TaxID=61149 RepID=A0A2P2ILJ8_RHIMU
MLSHEMMILFLYLILEMLCHQRKEVYSRRSFLFIVFVRTMSIIIFVQPRRVDCTS